MNGSNSGVLFGQILQRRESFAKLLKSKKSESLDIAAAGEKYLEVLHHIVFRSAKAQAASPVAEDVAVAVSDSSSGTATLTRPRNDDTSDQSSKSSSGSTAVSFTEARERAAAARQEKPFCWTGGLVNEKKLVVGSSDPLFDYCSALWNVLVAKMNVAQEKLQSERYNDEKKNVYKMLLEIACGWAFLEQQVAALAPAALDLKPASIQAMKQITHAQAIELALYIAMGNAAPGGGDQSTKFYETLVRLSRKIHELYHSSAKLMEQSGILDTEAAELKQFVLYKDQFFLSLANIENSGYLGSAGIDQGGASVAAAAFAQKVFKESIQKVYKSYSKTLDGRRAELLQQDYEALLKLLDRQEEKAKRENGMVYRQPVPDSVPRLLEAQSLGNVNAADWPVSKDESLSVSEVKYVGPYEQAQPPAQRSSPTPAAAVNTAPQGYGAIETQASSVDAAQPSQKQDDPRAPMLEVSRPEGVKKQRKKYKCEIL